jgi:uncharacterized protein YndB with AHSA1/START domain
VWKALTDADEVSRWLLPVSGDIVPKVGHRFTFTGPRGEPVSCEVVEARPARRLAYTWQAAPDAPPTLVTWTLTPLEAGTELVLEHDGSPALGVLGLRAAFGGAGAGPTSAFARPVCVPLLPLRARRRVARRGLTTFRRARRDAFSCILHLSPS